MGYSGAGGKLIHEKKQKQKILWHCPFKLVSRICWLIDYTPFGCNDLGNTLTLYHRVDHQATNN